jgi:hypothetical protein
MTKRFLMVAVAALALFAGVTAAYGAGRTKHKATDIVKVRVLSAGGSTAVYTGTIKDKTLGLGTIIVTATQGSGAGVSNFTATAFFKSGSVTTKGSDISTTSADGTGTDYNGKFKVVSGSGALKRATGSGTLKGFAANTDPTYSTYTLKDTLTY